MAHEPLPVAREIMILPDIDLYVCFQCFFFISLKRRRELKVGFFSLFFSRA